MTDMDEQTQVMDEEQKAFAATFGDDSDATETPQEEQSADDKQADRPATPAPEYVSLTKAEYERIQRALEELPQLEQRVGKKVDTAFGKIGVIEQKLASGGGVLTEQDLAPFKDDLPELYAALSKVRVPASGDPATAERFRVYDEGISRQERELRETQEALVESVHPDWREFSASQAFGEWLQQQDAQTRERLSTTWSPSVVTRALTDAKKYAATKAPQPSKSQQHTARAQAAIQPRGQGGRFAPSEATELEAYNASWRE